MFTVIISADQKNMHAFLPVSLKIRICNYCRDLKFDIKCVNINECACVCQCVHVCALMILHFVCVCKKV